MRPSRLSLAPSLLLASLSGCSVLPAPDDPLEAPIQQKADRIAREIARIRDLPQQREVPAGAKSKDELLEVMRGEIAKEWQEQRLDLGERAYKAFGLLPEDFDLEAYLSEFLREQVAGYYDPAKKEFFTVAEVAAKSGDGADLDAAITMPHELTHAIEDQHFDLEAKQQAALGDDDRVAALSALIEGSAMEGGVDHALDRAGVPLSTTGPVGRTVVGMLGRADALNPAGLADDDRLRDSEAGAQIDQLVASPPIVGWSLLFPYFQGWRFVNRVRSEFGWQAVDGLYADPPESTEQVLYPERYFDRRDRPVKVGLPAPPEGWKELHQQTLGMLGARILLATFLDDDLKDRADSGMEAADGWDGDRYVLWDSGNRDTIGWVVVFDHESEAADFAHAYRKLLKRRFGPYTTWAIDRRGLVVASVWNAPEDSADAAMLRLLDGAKLEVAPDDQPPDRWWWDVLRFPIAVQAFDRAWQWNLLGGYALHYRHHDGGHRFHLLSGLAMESENNADRNAFWLALGLIGFNHDRTLDYTYWRIPLVLDGHFRGEGSDYRSQYGLAIDALRYRNTEGVKQFSLLWELLLDVKWGAVPEDEHAVHFLMIPIPGTRATASTARLAVPHRAAR